jgi:hypothetical protein
MNRVVFLLEERSMKVLLDGLLPRLFPGLPFFCVPHEGKQDLEKSVPRKLRAWREPGVRFVVVRDNDGGDCKRLKERLVGLCEEGRRKDSLVRIACQELEAWYFGEPEALAEAFEDPRLAAVREKAPYREPDAIQCPSAELAKVAPSFQKISGARRMSARLTAHRNRSPSFHHLVLAVDRLFKSMSEPEGV